MKCIAGLGNPGEKYRLTRHNIGFAAIDGLSASPFRAKHESLIAKQAFESGQALLAKPQTFMNLSGRAVRAILSFYKISLEDLLVIHDDLDLPFLKMRFQKNRGHGGHNGIRNIHEELKSKNYARLKIGIKRADSAPQDDSSSASSGGERLSFLGSFLKRIGKAPPEAAAGKNHSPKPAVAPRSPQKERAGGASYVLSPFSSAERAQIERALPLVKEAVLCFMEEGFERAAARHN